MLLNRLNRYRSKFIKILFLYLFLFFFQGMFFLLMADDNVEHRINIGLKLFPTIVGGNLNLGNKLNDDGKLLLLIAVKKNHTQAQIMEHTLRQTVNNIYKYPLSIKVTDNLFLQKNQNLKIAGIFISEKFPKNELQSIIDFGIKNKTIVFSPFTDDVEQGAHAGIFIRTQIKPALNITTIKKTGIRFNKLFLKVAKLYE